MLIACKSDDRSTEDQMHRGWCAVTINDVGAVLDKMALSGPLRHLLLELFLVDSVSDWSRPHTEDHFLQLVCVGPDEGRALLQKLARDDLISCSQDMKSGLVSNIRLARGFTDAVLAHAEACNAKEEIRERAMRGPRPPTPGVKRQARDMFEGTCELCGDAAVRGKDQRGRDMVVSKVKKDQDGTADNVTLLCSKCSSDMRNRDLPSSCRTLAMLKISEQRGDTPAPRTAERPPPSTKEVVLTMSGPISVRTRTLDVEVPKVED